MGALDTVSAVIDASAAPATADPFDSPALAGVTNAVAYGCRCCCTVIIAIVPLATVATLQIATQSPVASFIGCSRIHGFSGGKRVTSRF